MKLKRYWQWINIEYLNKIYLLNVNEFRPSKHFNEEFIATINLNKNLISIEIGDLYWNPISFQIFINLLFYNFKQLNNNIGFILNLINIYKFIFLII